MPRKPPHPGLPTREAILSFIQKSREPAGKREIAKAFGIRGPDKVQLKALLKDMADEGLIDGGKGAFHKMGGLPKVTVLRVADIEGSAPLAVPERWEGDGPPPRLRVIERGRRSAFGIGDRILARIEDAGSGQVAHPIRKLEAAAAEVIGVLGGDVGPGGRPMLWLRSVDKRNRREWPVSDAGEAGEGDLVLATLSGKAPRQTARVTERLGDPFAPRALSLIAIHKYNLPHVFSDEASAEAERVAKLSLGTQTSHPKTARPEPVEGPSSSSPNAEDKADASTNSAQSGGGTGDREDLTHIPIIAIDPRDARDHDDAIWAHPRDDGGFDAIVAIADVSFYVRPGGALDKEARKRGNSVYFPDQVVPMLPHVLSSGVCSLKQDEDRAALACHMVIDASGKIVSWRFIRARVRLAANIAYEDAQAMIDQSTPLPHAGGAGGGPVDHMSSRSQRPTSNPSREREENICTALTHLWSAWALLAKARADRAPLELDLPERQVMLDDKGRIAEIRVRERLDAHRVVEDFMIAANVAAAKALEAKKSPVMYRVHEPPAREKLVALKEFLATYDMNFALGQVVTPDTFNRLLVKFEEPEARARMMEQLLRTQTQAYYSPVNAGHFGLALGSYGHFTSPIRRYADLLVHRALVAAYGLETPKPRDKAIVPTTALSREDGAVFARTGEVISAAERRAMEAERETIDRYVAAYLSEKVGQILPTRITGVQSFGFFAQVDGLGGDGLVPAATLGDEYFRWDEATQSLIGEHSGTRYQSGQRIDLRLVEANPLTGSLAFALPDAPPGKGRGAPRGGPIGRTGRTKPGDFKPNKRGRPGNIRHQSR
jgi:ribonuclease R